MNHRTLVGLPVDARPVVRAQVQQMLAGAGWTLEVPPVALLGHLRSPADRDALQGWLLDHSPLADGFVLSLDMLVYGGLVPSRFIADGLPVLLQRLAFVERLRAAALARPIVAFAATMRISNNNIAEEEKPYWAEHGRQLWAWSYHGDRAACTGAADSAAAAAAAEAAIPPAVRADYVATRERNFAVTLAALALVEGGVIDQLVLPQDDTAAWGLNIAERHRLQAEVQRRGLGARVSIRPGADEVMHTLCAALCRRLDGRRAPRVAIATSDPAHIGRLHALYEDRCVLDSVAAQVAAVGAELCGPEEPDHAADLLLAVHSQGTAQGDWAMQRPLPQAVPVAPAWIERIAAWQRQGRPVALADLAYANGGDPALLLLAGLPPPMAFAAYAGWNTASNSLGNVLAQAVLSLGVDEPEAEAQRRHNLALRWLEDLAYQADLRQHLRRHFDESQATPASLLAAARATALGPLNAWAAQHRLGHRVVDLTLPWNRSFEVDLQLEAEPA
jgi:hypothetical protein